MKQKLLVALCCATLMSCAQQPASSPLDFDRFANDWWEKVGQVQPNTKSGLPDMSAAALEKAHKQRLQLIAELNKTNVSHLTEQQKINFAILQYRLQNDIDEYRFGAHYMPLTAESGFHSDVLFMLNMSSVKTDKDIQTYLEKLAAVPTYMQQQISWMQQGLKTGYTQPKAVLAGYEDSIKSFISNDPTKSPFYRPLLKQPAGIDATRWQALQQQAKTLISSQITPVYQQYLDFFVGQYVPGARDNIAAVALPDGAAFYQNRLEHYTTLKMTPQQVHDIGLKEVARIRAEMQQVIDKTGFKGSFADFVQFLRTDPQFYVNTPEQLLKEAAYLSKKIDAQLPKLFKTLPRTPYGVEPVPAEIAPKYTTGRYSGGRAAGDPGFYWVNTYALDRRPLYELEALTLLAAHDNEVRHFDVSFAVEP